MALHQELAASVLAMRLAQLGPDARRALTATLVDTFGCMAAAADTDFAGHVVDASKALNGEGRCSIVGRRERLAAAAAAMVNGTLAHGFDFDDAHLPSLAHFSAIVIPATMAACELVGADGTAFLEGVVAGDEIGGRLGACAYAPDEGGSAIRARGFFPTSVLGTIAAAAATAKALRLEAGVTAEALAIACSYASGLAGISKGDNSSKRSQAGWAAQAGLAASLLARSGVRGPASVLEGDQGFLAAFTGPGAVVPRFAEDAPPEWIVAQMSFKPYPIEYVLQPLVELAGRARRQGIDAEHQVAVIEVSAPSRFISLFEPAAVKCAPPDAYAAALSGPYCIARAWTKREGPALSLDDFRDGFVIDDALRRLAGKVRFRPSAAIDLDFPRHLGGRMRLLKADGTLLWEDALDDVHGSPERPMSEADLLHKFRSNMRCLPLDADRLAERLGDLQREPDSKWISRLWTPA